MKLYIVINILLFMIILICFQVTDDDYYRLGTREGLLYIPNLSSQFAKKISLRHMKFQ
jgi:hypothetical protein